MTDQLSAQESLFIVRDRHEFCFLYPEAQPGELYQALLDCADIGEFGLRETEALEVIEELIIRSLRRL